MPTLNEMIDEVKSKLIGYTMNQDKVTYVNNASGLSLTGTSIEVGASNNFAKGIIEIDDELIWVDSYNKSTGTLSVIPGFGRGYLGTNPAPHARYSQITLSPTFPRMNIKQSINDTIQSLGASLYAVNFTTFEYHPSITTYALPDDADFIISASWESVGPSREWIPLKHWRPDKMANAASFNSNITISIYDPVSPGRTVMVWYATDPNTMENGSEDFVDVTGLPDTSKDVVVLGAVHRLLSFLDAGRINVTSAEADLNDTKIPSSAGANISKYIFALYQQRLKEEQSRQQNKFPVKIYYNR